MDLSVLYNNAGARALEAGRDDNALELFRAALEAKVASESSQRVEEDREGALRRSPDCTARADRHVDRMDANVQGRDGTDAIAGLLQNPVLGRPTEGTVSEARSVLPLNNRGYDPFLCVTPFQLPSSPTPPTELASAVIVFNLGLAHHIRSRTSAKAAAFYELAASLLSSGLDSPTTVLLEVVLLNNFGALCYERADGESVRPCIEYLSSLLLRSGVQLPSYLEEGVKKNVRWLLTPPNGASPAA